MAGSEKPTKSVVQEMMDRRKEELKKLGYPENAIDLALEWAIGTANGMAQYFTSYKDNHDDEALQDMLVTVLPRYLKDCDEWIKKTCL